MLHWLCCSGLGGWHAEIMGDFWMENAWGFLEESSCQDYEPLFKKEVGTLTNWKHLKTTFPTQKKIEPHRLLQLDSNQLTWTVQIRISRILGSPTPAGPWWELSRIHGLIGLKGLATLRPWRPLTPGWPGFVGKHLHLSSNPSSRSKSKSFPFI